MCVTGKYIHLTVTVTVVNWEKSSNYKTVT